MKFLSHLSYLKSKLSRFCGVSYRVMKYLNLRAARNYYYACVYSTLTYCINVWGGMLQCTAAANDLIKLQKRIVDRLFSKFYPNSACMFKAAGLLKLADIHKLYAAVYMYKIQVVGSCTSVGNLLDLTEPTHRYPTRHLHRLVPPQIRVESMKIDFKNQFIEIWNLLPSNIIEESGSLKAFKKMLMIHFIATY